MQRMKLKEWATLTGVAYEARKVRRGQWEATLRYRERRLVLPVRSWLRPDMKSALRELVLRARKADVCDGEFMVWVSKRAPGRSMDAYGAEWAPHATARSTLLDMFGEWHTAHLLWSVLDYP
jgi:hypothetical protein